MMLKIIAFALLSLTLACAGRKATRENVELADLHFRVGTGYLTGGNYPQALQEFLSAEKLDPNNAQILNNLGLIYYVREQTDLAIEKLQKALSLEPKFSEARNNLARIYIEKGNYPAAIHQLEIVNQDLLYRSPEKSWSNMGLAYFRLKQYEAAKSALQKAMTLNRQYCPAFVLFGRTLFEQKRYEEAAYSLDRAAAVCIKENYDEADYYSGLSYIKIGKNEEAKARMQEVIANFPNSEFAGKARSMLKLIR